MDIYQQQKYCDIIYKVMDMYILRRSSLCQAIDKGKLEISPSLLI